MRWMYALSEAVCLFCFAIALVFLVVFFFYKFFKSISFATGILLIELWFSLQALPV
jgi:uncharacterized membrane protein